MPPSDDLPAATPGRTDAEPTRGPGAAVLVGVAVLLLLAAAALLLGAGDAEPAELASDTPFTYFDGTEGSFADYRGQPLVVNFWASTCAPCVQEMPAFEQVHQRRGDEVAFLGLDVQERVEEGLTMVEATGVTYDLASDFEGFLLSETAPVAGLPTTAFIDAEGHVVDTHTGALDAEELEAKIDELLGR